MPELNEAAFAAGMQELRSKFILSIAERIAPIRDYLLTSIDEASVEQSARLSLHRLAGAAGSLGFDELASVVRELEAHLQTVGKDEQAGLIFTRLCTVIEAIQD